MTTTLMMIALLWAQVHAFTGTVLEVRDVVLVANTHAQVALVQSDYGQVWVILEIEPGRLTRDAVVLGSARPGDQVRVYISGSHVTADQVDWLLCQPADSDYCRFGSVYEAAPLSMDTNLPLSPSNDLIRFGRASSHYSGALYWNTIVLHPDRITSRRWQPFSQLAR